MSMRVGVPVSRGLDVALAIAKLRAVELHDIATVCKLRGESFDPRTDESECVFIEYVLFEGGDCDGPGQLFLAGECDLSVGDLSDAKKAIGTFAKEVSVCSSRPEPLCVIADLTTEAVKDVTDVGGWYLPRDWAARVDALVRKHEPPRVVVVDSTAMDASEEDRTRCGCGNFASNGPDCNACRARKRIERISLSPSDDGSPSKRARTADEDSE